VSGGVSGTLPGLLTIDNSTAFNDYFQGFNYGDSISFLITLGGPAIDSPNGTATSGSTFGFAMFDATGGNPLLTTDPNGNAFTIDVNLDGSTAVNDFSAKAQVALAARPVPEPASFWLLGIVLAGIIVSQCIVRQRRSEHKLEGES
jgi:PEP-CTERM motif